MRSPMDGSAPEALSALRKVVFPSSLALDAVKQRVYWADLRLFSVSSCAYDGSHQRTVVGNTYGPPVSVAFFEHRVRTSSSYTLLLHPAAVQRFEMLVLGTGALDQREPVQGAQHGPADGRFGRVRPRPRPPRAGRAPGAGAGAVGRTVRPLRQRPVPLGQRQSLYVPLSSGPHRPADAALPLRRRLLARRFAGTSSSSAAATAQLSGRRKRTSIADGLFQVSGGVSGVTVASIVVCLAVLAVLVVLGFVYQRRWKRLLFSTDSSPFQKFHFRTSGLDTGAHHERSSPPPPNPFGRVPNSSSKLMCCSSCSTQDQPVARGLELQRSQVPLRRFQGADRGRAPGRGRRQRRRRRPAPPGRRRPQRQPTAALRRHGVLFDEGAPHLQSRTVEKLPEKRRSILWLFIGISFVVFRCCFFCF